VVFEQPEPILPTDTNSIREFYSVGKEVYSRPKTEYEPARDIHGYPADLRWECSVSHFEIFKECYLGD